MRLVQPLGRVRWQARCAGSCLRCARWQAKANQGEALSYLLATLKSFMTNARVHITARDGRATRSEAMADSLSVRLNIGGDTPAEESCTGNG